MPWRPPKRLVILGKSVEIRLVTPEEMRDVVADNDGAEGAWDHDTGTIYILRGLSPIRKERAYLHELMHCLIDRFLDP